MLAEGRIGSDAQASGLGAPSSQRLVGGPTCTTSVDLLEDSGASDVAAWSDERVLAAIVEAEALARRADAWRVRLAAEVEQRSSRGAGAEGLAARRGCRNARELIRRVTGASDWSVSRWLRLGRATTAPTGLGGQRLPAQFEHVAAALHSHRIDIDAASRIVDTLNPVRDVAGDGPVRVAESELVAACAATTPGGVAPLDADSVRIQAATWAAFLDQDGGAPPEADLARRALRLGGMHRGMVKVSGLLMPEVAASLAAYADAATNPRTPDVAAPDSGADDADGAGTAGSPGAGGSGGGGSVEGASGAGGSEGGPSGGTASGGAASGGAAAGRAERNEAVDATEGRDPRTRPQVMHDILAAALGAAARVADQRSVAGNSPTVVVAVRDEDLSAGRGTGAVFSGDTFGAPAPMSMAAVRQLTCTGTTQRVAMGEGGAITALSSPTRCFTGQQRRAIALRDGGCVIPDCHVPAAWCEVHHVTPHADDGPTHTDNGVLLCWYHHRTIGTSGWTIRMRGGTPQVKAPPWLQALVHARAAGHGDDASDRDDGWQAARGSPTRMLEVIAARRRSSG